MAEFIYPFPGPYYIVETKKDAEIRHDLCTASSNDYICISGPNVTPGITVYRRWGEGVEPENTHCWGDCYGAIIARFPPSSGPALQRSRRPRPSPRQRLRTGPRLQDQRLR